MHSGPLIPWNLYGLKRHKAREKLFEDLESDISIFNLRRQIA
jgi:hypothetical protein